MALVTAIRRIEKRGQPHARCECSYFVVDTKDGRRFLTIETYGSENRQIPGKVSQSIQFGEEGARRLRELIETVFPNLT